MNRRRFFTGAVLVFLLSALSVSGQPEPLMYQFVVRDQDGEVVDEEQVEVQLTIREGHPRQGKMVYREQHQTSTTENGMVQLSIGEGQGRMNFSSVTWDLSRSYFVTARVEGLNGEDVDFQHVSQLLMFSPRVFTGTADDLADQGIDTAGMNLRALTIRDNKVYLANGGVVELPKFIENVNSLLIQAGKKDVSCHGGNDGYIDISVEGGFPPYTYRWSNGDSTQDVDNLKAGTYEVYVKDSKGYTAIRQVTIDQPAPLKVNAEVANVSGVGLTDGSISLQVRGGLPPYSYQWSMGDTTSNVSELAPGSYQVMVSSANGCSISRDFVVREPVRLSFNKQNVRCYGEKNGVAEVNIHGGNAPYRVQWSNGQSGKSISNLGAGKYYVSVKDSWGYQAVDSVRILQPYPLKLKDSVINISDERQYGSIQLHVEGGISPYHYLWSTGDTTRNLTGIEDGVYSVSVEDSRGCRISSDNIFVYREMTDPRDTTRYRVITIGGQAWMAENLNIGRQTPLDQISRDNEVVEKYCYNDSKQNCQALGGLYTWDEAVDYSRPANKTRKHVQGICPDGWHIPSEKEWKALAEHLGGEMVAGNKLKAIRYWERSLVRRKEKENLDITGFNALPAGRIDLSGESYYKGTSTSFWSSSRPNSDKAWHRTITIRGSGLYRDASFTSQRYSVRCVRDTIR